MPQKIYIGPVKIRDSRTGKILTVDRKIYKEREDITHGNFRGYVLKRIPAAERKYYQIIQLCYESARVTGTTNY